MTDEHKRNGFEQAIYDVNRKIAGIEPRVLVDLGVAVSDNFLYRAIPGGNAAADALVDAQKARGLPAEVDKKSATSTGIDHK